MNLPTLARPRVRPVAAALLGCLLLPLATGICTGADHPPPQKTASINSQAKPIIAGDLEVSAAWARATAGSTPGAAYFTVTNRGKLADTLLGATTPVATSVVLHQTMQSNGMAHMRPAGELGIAPGQVLKVEPGGLHLMLDGLKQPLAAGARIPLVLNFRRAGAVTVQVDVMPITAATPGDSPRQSTQHGNAAD